MDKTTEDREPMSANRMCDQVQAEEAEAEPDFLADAQACPLRGDPSDEICESCQ